MFLSPPSEDSGWVVSGGGGWSVVRVGSQW